MAAKLKAKLIKNRNFCYYKSVLIWLIVNVIIPKWTTFVSEHDMWIQWNIGKDIYAHRADKLKENNKNSNYGYEWLKFVRNSYR